MLDGLVGGAVLTQADGVVCHHIDHTNLCVRAGGMEDRRRTSVRA